MNLDFPAKPPRSSIAALLESSATGTCSQKDLASARDWLRRVLVDYEALRAHVDILKDYRKVECNIPQSWNHDLCVSPTAESGERSVDTLDDELTLQVIDHGVDCLNESDLSKLIGDTSKLFELFEFIQEVQPECWQEPSDAFGRALYEASSKSEEVTDTPQNKPTLIRNQTTTTWNVPWNAVSALASVAAIVVCMVVLNGQRAITTELASLRAGAPNEVDSGGQAAISLHSTGRIANWEDAWVFDPDDAEGSLDAVKADAPSSLKTFIGELESREFTASEILAQIKHRIQRDKVDRDYVEDAYFEGSPEIQATITKLRDREYSSSEIRAVLEFMGE